MEPEDDVDDADANSTSSHTGNSSDSSEPRRTITGDNARRGPHAHAEADDDDVEEVDTESDYYQYAATPAATTATAFLTDARVILASFVMFLALVLAVVIVVFVENHSVGPAPPTIPAPGVQTNTGNHHGNINNLVGGGSTLSAHQQSQFVRTSARTTSHSFSALPLPLPTPTASQQQTVVNGDFSKHVDGTKSVNGMEPAEATLQKELQQQQRVNPFAASPLFNISGNQSRDRRASNFKGSASRLTPTHSTNGAAVGQLYSPNSANVNTLWDLTLSRAANSSLPVDSRVSGEINEIAAPPIVTAALSAPVAFRALTLLNGIRVMLVSDPSTPTAAAAVNVDVGSLSDPPEIMGLSHLLEHMLFLGTTAHPKENFFQTSLALAGGSSNAYTDLEDTNYYFDVQPHRLGKMLEVFSEFFKVSALDYVLLPKLLRM